LVEVGLYRCQSLKFTKAKYKPRTTRQEFTDDQAARWVDIAFDDSRSEAWQVGWYSTDAEIARIFAKPIRLRARRG
jgi:hypothetical protein